MAVSGIGQSRHLGRAGGANRRLADRYHERAGFAVGRFNRPGFWPIVVVLEPEEVRRMVGEWAGAVAEYYASPE